MEARTTNDENDDGDEDGSKTPDIISAYIHLCLEHDS